MTDEKRLPLVEVLPIEKGATVDPDNVNRHTEKGGKFIENSLRQRGAFRSIASAGKGVKVPVTKAGSHTLEKAVAIGITEIVNVHVRGDQLVNVVRDDLDPDSPEAAMLGIEDNRIAEVSLDWDTDLLAAFMKGESALLRKFAKGDNFTDAQVLRELAAETVPMNVIDDGDFAQSSGGRNNLSGLNKLVGIGSFLAPVPKALASQVADILRACWGDDAAITIPIFLDWIIKNESLFTRTEPEAS